MPERVSKRRVMIAMLIIIVIASLYILRLAQWQLVEGEDFLATAQKSTVRTVSIPAPRGEIVDCNGRAIAYNKTCYCIQFDLAFLTQKYRNGVLNEVIKLCAEQGEEYYDTLPITPAAPYTYIESDETSLKRLKTLLDVDSLPINATEAINALAKHYTIDSEEFSPAEIRFIAGVRYEMDQRGASVQNPYVFARDISIETVTLLKERSSSLPGVDITTEAVREYADGTVAPHIIGSVGSIYADELEKYIEKGYSNNDLVGKSGIEKSMEDILRGTAGERQIVQNSLGQVISSTVTKEPVPGATVVLSLNTELQVKAQTLLEKQIKYIAASDTKKEGGYDCNAGSIVMSNVKTGEVIAMATYPSYDAETMSENYSALINDNTLPLLNRATQGVYAPGSTFKPTTALSALEADVIKGTSDIVCRRVYNYYDVISKCLGYHGSINVVEAIGHSCNVFFYEAGRLTGFDTIHKYAEMFGFTDVTGLEIAESAGRISERNIIMTAIGQADTALTPAQLCNYIATWGNGGTHYKMTLIDSVVSYDYSTVIDANEPQILNSVECDKENWDTVMKGLYSTVEGGLSSASRYFATANYSLGAKTGTAQVSSGSDSGVFVAFAPYEDAEVAISVVLEHAGSSSKAAPLARQLLDAYFEIIYNDDALMQSGVVS